MTKTARELFPSRWLDSGATANAAVAALRGGRELPYSTDIAEAWDLFREMEASEKCAVMVQRTLHDSVTYECSIVYGHTTQTQQVCINGFSDTAAGAICAAYVQMVNEKVAKVAA